MLNCDTKAIHPVRVNKSVFNGESAFPAVEAQPVEKHSVQQPYREREKEGGREDESKGGGHQSCTRAFSTLICSYTVVYVNINITSYISYLFMCSKFVLCL